ncbi:hypothetical protein [Methylocystis echinoides]|uniref:hypothetical protein n=1 Tax=Methylocystis echinoides TaxID=29468 RepID=UPI003417379B
MTPHEIEQIAVALAAVVDASLSSLDPSGAALRQVGWHLREGLKLAEQMDACDSDAAKIVRQFLQNIESESE